MQKLFEPVSSFEVIEQRLYGNARAYKDRRPTEPVGVAMYHVLGESQ